LLLRGAPAPGSVAKLIVTYCYPQLVVFFTLKSFKIWLVRKLCDRTGRIDRMLQSDSEANAAE
jgi:hypothetical protein